MIAGVSSIGNLPGTYIPPARNPQIDQANISSSAIAALAPEVLRLEEAIYAVKAANEAQEKLAGAIINLLA